MFRHSAFFVDQGKKFVSNVWLTLTVCQLREFGNCFNFGIGCCENNLNLLFWSFFLTPFSLFLHMSEALSAGVCLIFLHSKQRFTHLFQVEPPSDLKIRILGTLFFFVMWKQPHSYVTCTDNILFLETDSRIIHLTFLFKLHWNEAELDVKLFSCLSRFVSAPVRKVSQNETNGAGLVSSTPVWYHFKAICSYK